MKNTGVYSITNLINNRKYIGYSVNLKHREISHFSDLKLNKHRNSYLQNCYNKYDKQNFKFEILEYCERELLAEKEHYWVLYYKSNIRKYGYNIQTTGVLGIVKPMSDETKKKISKRHKGRKITEEQRLRLLSIIIKKQTPEHIQKVIDSRKKLIAERGYFHSEEAKKKMSDLAKIRGISNATKQGFLLKVKGQPNLKKRIKIKQYDLENNFIKEWTSASEAAKFYNCTPSLINLALKNKLKSAKNFIWKYA
jgi:group I intron endonuclease